MRGHEDLHVVVAGGVVGEVRLAERGGDLVVHEATLVSPEHTAVLGSLLECRAIAAGVGRILLDGDEGALGGLVASGWAEPASQRLRLDLAAEPDLREGTAVEVRLAPMGGEAFAAFHERLTQGWVTERASSGESPDRARRTVLDRLDALLPDGPATPDQHLLTGWDGDRVVGHLWLGSEPAGAVVHHVEVAEEERRRGYGAGLLRGVERWAREHDRAHVRLDVVGHDTAVRALGDRLGYRVTRATYRRLV